jgi:hypothetical protein
MSQPRDDRQDGMDNWVDGPSHDLGQGIECLLPIPASPVAVGPTSELVKRRLSTIGNLSAIRLQRLPLNSSLKLSVKGKRCFQAAAFSAAGT